MVTAEGGEAIDIRRFSLPGKRCIVPDRHVGQGQI